MPFGFDPRKLVEEDQQEKDKEKLMKRFLQFQLVSLKFSKKYSWSLNWK